MNKFIIFSFLLVFLSCQENSKIENLDERIEAEKRTKELLENAKKEKIFENENFEKQSPIKIISYKITDRNSRNRGIYIKFKNISKETVKAIKFEWFAENAFNEPAEINGVSDGIGEGFADKIMNPNKTDEGTWAINSTDIDKIVKIRPYLVVFVNGTTWNLKELK